MPWLLEDDLKLAASEDVRFAPAGRELSFTPANVGDDSGSRSLYRVDKWPAVRAYIYNEPPSRRIRCKIGAMAAHPVEYMARAHFAWPIDIIVDESGLLVGYIGNFAAKMDKLSNVLSSGALSYNVRIRLAQNICVALEAFHRQGLVFGSLTTESVLVDMKTLRVFLNPSLNSAQLEDAYGNLHPCRLGVPEYLAPEVHDWLISGRPLQEIARQRLPQFEWLVQKRGMRSCLTRNTDLYALGVIVFALLYDGRHPMSCTVDGITRFASLGGMAARGEANPMPSAILAGRPPRTRLTRGTFGIYACRMFWRRGKGGAAIFDSCFGIPNQFAPRRTQWQVLHDLCFGDRGWDFAMRTQVPPRPSAQEWHSYLERRGRGVRARLSRFFDRLNGRLKQLRDDVAAPASTSRERRQIVNQYPHDLAGSEALSSPRVFWRTTVLAALGTGLGLAMLMFAFVSVQQSDSVCGALIIGAILSCLMLNFALGKLRGLAGYKPWHYAVSIIGTIVVSILCGALAGGVL